MNMGKAIRENCVVIMREKMEQMLDAFYNHSVEKGGCDKNDNG